MLTVADNLLGRKMRSSAWQGHLQVNGADKISRTGRRRVCFNFQAIDVACMVHLWIDSSPVAFHPRLNFFDVHMILRDFVSHALQDILGGVRDAQAKTEAGAVVPANISNTMSAVNAGISPMQVVDFEVTVRADEQSGRESHLSVVSAVFGAGIKGKTGKNEGHAATLRFRVPVKLSESLKK